MTKTAIWLPLALIAAAAVGLMGLLSFGESADANHGDHATVAIGSATVAPGGAVTVDLTVTLNPNGTAESGANCGDTLDNDSDGHVDDGCPLGALDANVGYTAADFTGTAGCTANFGGVCNATVNPVTYSIANLGGISGVAGTLTLTAGATETASTLTLTVTTCGDQAGGTVTCGATNGTITIAQATATPTPSPSPSPSPTQPGGVTGTPTASPTRSPTPAGLPPTGGSDDGSSSLPWLLAIMGVAAAAAAGWATIRLRRVKA